MVSEQPADDNAKVVLGFAQTAFVDRRPQDAVDSFVGDRYIQHNPDAPDGKDGFVTAISGMFAAFPNYEFEVKRAVSQNDLVAVHSYMNLTGEGPGNAVMDFFRLEDGKIVEHWDVVQAVPEESANSNTMF
jgi:predicted SnoaL-like aldol condensation-catalyzing enzyme